MSIWLLLCIAAAAANEVYIVAPLQQFKLRLAAREIRRYGSLTHPATRFLLASNQSQVPSTAESITLQLSPVHPAAERYQITPASNSLTISAHTDQSILFGAYHFCEISFGIHFDIAGDTIPSARQFEFRIRHSPINQQLTFSPAFSTRGVNPFHDFYEGPDWWTADNYKSVMEQLTKMRMNFLGLHNYNYYSETAPSLASDRSSADGIDKPLVKPLVGPWAEPLIWQGPMSAVGPTGNVSSSYLPSSEQAVMWMNTGARGREGPNGTGSFLFGANQLFSRQCYGSTVRTEDCPYDLAKGPQMYNSAAQFLSNVFAYGRSIGVHAGMGSEVPAMPPRHYNTTLVRLSIFWNPIDHFLTQHSYACQYSSKCDWMPPASSASYTSSYYHHSIQCWVHWSEEIPFTHQLVQYWNGTNTYLGIAPPPVLANTYKAVTTSGRAFAPNVSASQLPDGASMDDLWPLRVWHDINTGDQFVTCNALLEEDAVNNGYVQIMSVAGYVYKARPDRWVQDMYEGTFSRLLNSKMIEAGDTFWLWTQEIWSARMNGNVRGIGDLNSTAVTSVVQDFLAADAARKQLNATFGLATSGWTLGPLADRAYFDKVLPEGWALSSIDENLGESDVEPEYSQVTQHDSWSIPWMEDDPGLALPQMWVNRTITHLNAAHHYGVDGGLGILWRIKANSANVYAVARRGWAKQNLTAVSVWQSWVNGSFGSNCDIPAIAEAFAALEGQRPATYGLPGLFAISADQCKAADNLRPNVSALVLLADAVVDGPQYSHAFDYWRNQYQYLLSGTSLACNVYQYYAHANTVRNHTTAAARKAAAINEGLLEKRIQIVSNANELANLVLGFVSGPGDLGVITTLMDTFLLPNQTMLPNAPSVLNLTAAQELSEWLGTPLPSEAYPNQSFTGDRRIIVPAVRTRLEAGEQLQLVVMLLLQDADVIQNITCHYKPFGSKHDTAVLELLTVPNSSPTANVFSGQLPELDDDFSYFLQVYLLSNDVYEIDLLWPPGAPSTSQSVVVV